MVSGSNNKTVQLLTNKLNNKLGAYGVTIDLNEKIELFNGVSVVQLPSTPTLNLRNPNRQFASVRDPELVQSRPPANEHNNTGRQKLSEEFRDQYYKTDFAVK